MKQFVAALFMSTIASSAYAGEWSIDDMNAHVDQTNFIVDNQCSGTLISVKEKLLLTNNHCVERSISVIEEESVDDEGSVVKRKREKFADVPVAQGHYKDFDQTGQSSYLMEIVAHDKKADLAVLRFKQDTIPFTLFSPILPDGIELKRGQPTITVGNPAGLEASVVRGEIMSLTRKLEIGGQERPYIQYSGGTFGGNSGGALYNADGQLIGIPAAGFRDGPTYIGFAIPAQVLRDFLKDSCLESVYNPDADDAKCKADKEAKAKGKSDKE
jgi:S1-C subfamily serine protease